MAQQKVELRKVRDFSENLNDTFLFLKQNFKPLLTYVLGITGIFILATAIVSAFYQSNANNIIAAILEGNTAKSQSPGDIFNGFYFLLILFAWLSGVSLQVVITAYFKVYDEENPTPRFEQVWKVFARNFIPIALYNIPLAILTVVGFMFCLAPGVYLGVVLAPFTAIVVIENKSFGEAFNRCFTLIKENFWMSLGIYLVVFLISYFGSGIISLVFGLLSGLISYFTTNDIKATLTIASSVMNVLGFVFYILLFVSVTFNYYNLTERHDGTGIMKRLETMGTGTANQPYHPHGEEEY